MEVEKKFKEFLDENDCMERASEQIFKKFKEKFKKDKRTFQRWRRNILLGIRMFEDTNGKYRKNILRKGECYFCETKDKLLVHHLNLNRNDNKDANLLVLCPKCHKRLHFIYNKIR